MKIETAHPFGRHIHAALSLMIVVSIAAVITACGGGGGGGGSTMNPPPNPSPSPTQSPVSCSLIARHSGLHVSWQARLRPQHPAVISRRIGPGPSRPICPSAAPGYMRCMAWMRTDIGRTPSVIPSGYSPANLQAAYGLASASSADGGNQTVVIVDAYDDPGAEADLAVYRNTFGLSACTTANGCFLKVNQFGATSPLPATDSTGNWEAEESLDLDMVSAVCPNCEIVLMETMDPGLNNLYGAEDTAASSCGATVISNSWGGGEYPTEASDEVNFNHPGIMITFAAGDFGYSPSQSGYPSGSQYVTSVGGTSLSQGGGGTWTQTAWSGPAGVGGTGSICSAYIAQPAWQTALGSAYTSVCSTRMDNDVSAVADPNTGVAVYDTFGGGQGCSTWCVIGGTSASAPIIGAVYALAGNGASLTYGSYAYSHVAGNLTDVTSGSNGPCPGNTFICIAGVGYDGPTGLGTPNGIGAF